MPPDQPRHSFRHPQALGRRRQAVIMHCGTILPTGISNDKLTPPQQLCRKGKEEELEEWCRRP